MARSRKIADYKNATRSQEAQDALVDMVYTRLSALHRQRLVLIRDHDQWKLPWRLLQVRGLQLKAARQSLKESFPMCGDVFDDEDCWTMFSEAARDAAED